MWRALPPRLRIAFGLLVGLIVLTVVALLDANAHRGRPLRNTFVGGRDVGGLSPASFDRVISAIEADYRRSPIRIALPGGGFTLTGAEIGLTIDRSALRSEALNTGRSNGALGSYVRSFVSQRRIGIPVEVDPELVATALRKAEGDAHIDPVEPRLIVRGGEFAVTPGKDGRGISAAAVASAIPALFAAGDVPVTVSTTSVVLPSRFSSDDLRSLVSEAQRLTSTTIVVKADDRSAVVPTRILRSWVKPTIEDGKVRIRLDRDLALIGVAKLLGNVGKPATDAKLSVDERGAVTAIPSSPGTRCCTVETADRLEKALGLTDRTVVEIALADIEPKLSTEEVLKLGVKEKIGEFTTKHKAGEDRVVNIHHIADLLRGTVIPPGATFSVNDVIGPRSAANGFVKAHVIEDGVFTENYGGGISQFATTMFNASFFGGLDLLEYQSHSLYLSRYPFGREATLSFPHPDLIVRNPSPYGILIWPTYTNSTITVTLYSTKFAVGVAGEPSIKKKGKCQIVSTVRTRTFTDGTVKTDTIKASYRPKEGIDCEGNPTPGNTTTTEPGSSRATDESARPRPRDTSSGDSGPATTKAPTSGRGTESGNAGPGNGEQSGDDGDGGAPDPGPPPTKKPKVTARTSPPPEPVQPAEPPASVVQPAAPPVNEVS